MRLSDLLEQQSNIRAMSGPSVEPAVPVPAPPPGVAQLDAHDNEGVNLGMLLTGLLGNQGKGGGGSVGPGPTGGPVNNVEALARRWAMNRYGYSPSDWNKLDYIIENESSWNPQALNESSGAAGIAQKITGWEGNYQPDNPRAQLRWLFNYIDSHNYPGYGTGIDAAYSHKQDTGWY